MPKFTPTPTPAEQSAGKAQGEAQAAQSVPELRRVVADLAERLLAAETEIQRLYALMGKAPQ